MLILIKINILEIIRLSKIDKKFYSNDKDIKVLDEDFKIGTEVNEIILQKIIDSDIAIFLLGTLLAFSTLILPNVGINFFGINLEDLPFIFASLFFLIFFLNQKSFYHE